MSVRVRFAPSPTGFLHVGGARTALFNWLFARKHHGVFVLRIEDTDRARSDEEMSRVILHALEWLGLNWDEGPYFQSRGLARHQRDARSLLDEGRAYPDFTPAEERARPGDKDEPLARGTRPAREAWRAMGEGEAARRMEAGEPCAIRFLVPEGETAWVDMIHGPKRFDNRDLDDLVILRSDGTPTYNLAVVSDDAQMEITHVIRGDDHLSNTPKQILLYEALGKSIPRFAHVPLILGPDGKRLSKRHGATAVGEYEERGILPAAMVNFLALLGWSPGDDRQLMDLDEIVEAFSVDRILKKSAVFDLEKLEWLSGQHMSRMSAEALAPQVTERLVATGRIRAEDLETRRDWFLRVMDLLKVRARSLDDVAAQAMAYVLHDVDVDPAAARRHWKEPGVTADALETLMERLSGCPWDEASLEATLRDTAASLGVGAGKLIHPLRVAITGQAVSPGIFEVMTVLGRERVSARVEKAVARMRSGALPERTPEPS